jgi:hypothetical protein
VGVQKLASTDGKYAFVLERFAKRKIVERWATLTPAWLVPGCSLSKTRNWCNGC